MNMNKLLVLVVLYSPGAIIAQEHAPQGEAIISIENETFTLALLKCYSAANIVDGESVSAFVIATHKSRRSKEPGPSFTAHGNKTTVKAQAIFRLSLDGGFSNGGIDYRSTIPYESFVNNNLSYEGQVKSIKKDNSNVVETMVPITIKVVCK